MKFLLLKRKLKTCPKQNSNRLTRKQYPKDKNKSRRKSNKSQKYPRGAPNR